MYNQTAQTLAQQGRYGDNMLVHMNPQEVAGLAALARAHGGHISINPKTGLPEAWGIGSIFGSKGILGQAAKAVGLGDAYASASKAVSNVGRAITPFASMILPFTGIGLPLSSLLSGLAGGVTKGGFDWKRGLLSGALSYGLGSLTAPSTTGATSLTSPAPIDLAVDSAGITNLPAATASNVQIPSITPSGTVVSSGIPLDTAPVGAPLTMTSDTMTLPPVSAPSAPVTAPAPVTSAPLNAVDYADLAVGQNAPITEPFRTTVFNPEIGQNIDVRTGNPVSPVTPAHVEPTMAGQAADYVKNALRIAKEYTPSMKDIKDYAGLASAGVTAYGGYKSYQEQKKAKEEAARILAAKEAHTQQQIDWANQVMSAYPSRFERLTAEDVEKYGIGTQRRMAAGGYARSFDDELGSDDEVQMYGGGLGTLQNGLRFARGGMPPRFLQGQGDGMSDSIPARIAGRQEARLADGEFVIPADVVSHIGNGSSKAGAQKLYGMMDRVRKARTGKTRQAPAINAGGLMPA